MNNDKLNEILEYIREELKPIIEELKPKAKQMVKIFTKKVAKDYLPQLKKFVEDLLKSKNIKYESVDVLTKSDMVSLIRLNKVNGSDGVAAYKQTKDEKTIIYFAYCKDRELIQENENCYIVIEAQKLNKDVEELFDESDLIILQ